MADTIEIIQGTATTVEVAGPTGPQGPAGAAGATGAQGPQGVPGTGLEVLTTQGDLLYQGASTGQRLPIGTSGQILRVANGIPEWGAESGAVSSVAGKTGSVTLDKNDVGLGNVSNAAQVTSVTGTAPISSSGGTTPAISISAASTSAAGSMSSADKTKLDGIASGANNYTHPNHSGDVTSVGDGATTIANDAVSNAKLANMATATIKGRATASTGDPEDLSASDVRTLLNTDQVTDARTPLSHTHGNLTNAGAIGTTANLPLRTGTNGVVEAGSFGTAAGSFCEGNDARLSDARTPSSTLAHKASHATGGTDALAPSDIGAQSIFATEDLGTITANVTLTAARAKIYTVTVNTFDTPTPSVQLPTTNVQAGDVVQIRFTSNTGRQMPVRNGNDSFLGSSLTNGQRATYIAASTSNDSWAEDGTNRHTHAAADITSGTLDVARLPVGTGSTQVAAGNHTHVVADVTGAAASGSITTSGLTQATARILGRTSASTGSIEEIQIGAGLSLSAGELSSTVSAGIPATLLDAKGDLIVASAADTAARLAVGGTNGHVLTVDSNETLGVKWAAATGGSGVTAVGTTLADILSVSGSDLVADDLAADKLYGWDDSESKAIGFIIGSGLSVSGDTISVAGGGATNLWIPASAWIPKTTAGCGVDSRETTTNDQNFDELLFDAGTDEFADALVVMPSNYNNGTITARFYWTAASGSGGVAWAIQGRAFANDDALDTAAGTAQLVTDTLIAANDMHVTSATSAVTIGGTPAANTPIQFTIYRDVSDAGDDLAVDARLLGVEIIFN